MQCCLVFFLFVNDWLLFGHFTGCVSMFGLRAYFGACILMYVAFVLSMLGVRGVDIGIRVGMSVGIEVGGHLAGG